VNQSSELEEASFSLQLHIRRWNENGKKAPR